MKMAKRRKDDDKRLRELMWVVMIRKRAKQRKERKEGKKQGKRRESDIVSTSDYNSIEIETKNEEKRNKKKKQRVANDRLYNRPRPANVRENETVANPKRTEQNEPKRRVFLLAVTFATRRPQPRSQSSGKKLVLIRYTTWKRGQLLDIPCISIHVDSRARGGIQLHNGSPLRPTARCCWPEEREGLTDPWETENSAGDHLFE
jgi:hypothetical protein